MLPFSRKRYEKLRISISALSLDLIKHRKEILFLLLTDVVDAEDNEPISQRDTCAGGVAEQQRRPRSRRKYADFFYYTKVLIPKLQTV